MNRPHLSFPSLDEGLALHRRLQFQDVLAPSDVCAAYLEPLLDWLAGGFPRIEPHLREGAAHEALFDYVQHPDRYDPGRGDLAVYLRMAARADLLNALRREKRHHRGRVAWSAVELGEESGNLSGREEEPLLLLQRGEDAAERERILRSVAEGLTAPERRVLELMVAGERWTALYAEALGLHGLSAEEQEREVKRVKDRIKKRIQRGGRKHD
jgi:DNA-directed RNA polymerase specialized sigma24 family protein